MRKFKKDQVRSEITYTRLTKKEKAKVIRLAKRYKMTNSDVLQQMVQMWETNNDI